MGGGTRRGCSCPDGTLAAALSTPLMLWLRVPCTAAATADRTSRSRHCVETVATPSDSRYSIEYVGRGLVARRFGSIFRVSLRFGLPPSLLAR